MVIFLDVILIENFIVNYFLLNITCKTLKIRVKSIWVALSSLFGTSYILTLVIPSISFLSKLPFKFVTAFIMILIILKKKDFFSVLKAFILFISYSMLIAGICLFLQGNAMSWKEVDMVIYNFSYKKLIISLMIIYIIIQRIVDYVQDKKVLTSLIYDVEIGFKESKTKVKAFLDTGNELKEPVTNLPVILVERRFLNNINFENYNKYYISYSVIGGTIGRLEVIKPIYVKIYDGRNVYNKEAFIAACDNKLSDIDEYNALLSRSLL